MKCFCKHDDVIKWKHFPRYWPFVFRNYTHWICQNMTRFLHKYITYIHKYSHLHAIFCTQCAPVMQCCYQWPLLPLLTQNNTIGTSVLTNDNSLSTEPVRIKLTEIRFQIQTFSIKKLHLNLSSAMGRHICSGVNLSIQLIQRNRARQATQCMMGT